MSSKPWVGIRIDLKWCIRIHSATNVEPQHWFKPMKGAVQSNLRRQQKEKNISKDILLKKAKERVLADTRHYFLFFVFWP
jgi:hypothetical protein